MITMLLGHDYNTCRYNCNKKRQNEATNSVTNFFLKFILVVVVYIKNVNNSNSVIYGWDNFHQIVSAIFLPRLDF